MKVFYDDKDSINPNAAFVDISMTLGLLPYVVCEMINSTLSVDALRKISWIFSFYPFPWLNIQGISIRAFILLNSIFFFFPCASNLNLRLYYFMSTLKTREKEIFILLLLLFIHIDRKYISHCHRISPANPPFRTKAKRHENTISCE